jgi:hypothetical protein
MGDTATDSQQAPADPGRQRRHAAGVAALALAVGKPVRAAATRAGIGERTLYTWLKRPTFRRRVAELRERLVAEAVGRLSRAMAGAAWVLVRLLRSEDEATRLRAARAILELGVKVREHGELERRLAELEESLGGRDVGYGRGA